MEISLGSYLKLEGESCVSAIEEITVCFFSHRETSPHQEEQGLGGVWQCQLLVPPPSCKQRANHSHDHSPWARIDLGNGQQRNLILSTDPLPTLLGWPNPSLSVMISLITVDGSVFQLTLGSTTAFCLSLLVCLSLGPPTAPPLLLAKPNSKEKNILPDGGWRKKEKGWLWQEKKEMRIKVDELDGTQGKKLGYPFLTGYSERKKWFTALHIFCQCDITSLMTTVQMMTNAHDISFWLKHTSHLLMSTQLLLPCKMPWGTGGLKLGAPWPCFL